MATERTRFQDRGRHLWPMGERILVRCPECAACATVHRRETGPAFSCLSCGASRSGSGAGWAGMAVATISHRCGWCGTWLQRTLRKAGEHPSKVRVGCPTCAHWSDVQATWLPPPLHEPYDPAFGLPLWLQTRCAGNVLWALNAEHLRFLRDYVAAEVREREPNRNGSLASRLPAWIKKGSNRAALLRGLARLERKAAAGGILC